MDLELFSEDHQSSLHKINQENELERLQKEIQSKNLKRADLCSNSNSNYTDF